jgi:hypothetical protein
MNEIRKFLRERSGVLFSFFISLDYDHGIAKK